MPITTRPAPVPVTGYGSLAIKCAVVPETAHRSFLGRTNCDRSRNWHKYQVNTRDGDQQTNGRNANKREAKKICQGHISQGHISQTASRFRRPGTHPLPIRTQVAIGACQPQTFTSTTSPTPNLSVMLSNIPTRQSMVCSLDVVLQVLPLTLSTRCLSSITGPISVL